MPINYIYIFFSNFIDSQESIHECFMLYLMFLGLSNQGLKREIKKIKTIMILVGAQKRTPGSQSPATFLKGADLSAIPKILKNE